jgi:hypothetical protein
MSPRGEDPLFAPVYRMIELGTHILAKLPCVKFKEGIFHENRQMTLVHEVMTAYLCLKAQPNKFS